MTFTKHLKLTRPLIALTFVAVGFAMPRVATAETLADALVSAYNHSGLLEPWYVAEHRANYPFACCPRLYGRD